MRERLIRFRRPVLVILVALVMAAGGFIGGVAWERDQDEDRGPRLSTGNLGGFGGVAGSRIGATYASMWIGEICLTEPGPAEILSVEPVRSVGGTISDFSVYLDEGANRVGISPRRIAKEPAFGSGNDFVADRCGKPFHGLAIELHRTERNMMVNGVELTYRIDGVRRVVRVAGRFGLCVDLDLPACTDLLP